MSRIRSSSAMLLAALAWWASTTPVAAAATVERRLLDSRIVESSGLAASTRFDGVLWTHNDSGDVARIFAVGPDGRTRATYRLSGLVPRDWEAIAASVDAEGRRWLWVGDIGDNSESRTLGILVHRVAEPDSLTDGSLAPVSYRLRYPDGPHDAEALLVHPRTGRLYLVTKEIFGGHVYRAPAKLTTKAPNELELLGGAPSVVTDGVFLPDGRAVLRDYSAFTVISSLEDPHAKKKRVPVTMPDLGDQPSQAESVAVGPDNTVLLGTEGTRSPVILVAVPDLSGVTPTKPKTTPEESKPATSGGSSPRNTGVLVAAAGAALLAGAVLAASRRRY